jgi:cystathionine beta-lyase
MLASPGVMPGLAASILGLTGPGDSVIVQPPVYYPFALRIRANGRQVVENPLQLSGDRWEMDLDGLETAGGQGARMLVLCSPHNPVSRVWETKVLLRLAEICARRKIVIVSDEIHADIVMPGFHHVPLASVSAQAAASSVTLLSATKSFNLAGLGGSLTVIPDPGLRAKVDAVQHALFAGVANAPAVAASEAAWRLGDRWLDEMLSYVEGNHRFLMHFLAARLPAVKVFPLEGTYLALLDLRALGLSDEQATEKLRNDAKVWLDEGRKFGRAGEGMQRLNLACPRGLLMDALERMAKALAPGG